MVASLTYRTNDGSRWGAGQGSDLSATTIDINFWTLFSAVQALEDHDQFAAGIDFISQPTNGNQFYVHLTDHRVLGPFFIPTANWTARGTWAPSTPYALFDTVGFNGSLYLVLVQHTSDTSFNPNATDGQAHQLYALILQQPANELPANGTSGQRLVKSTDSPYSTEWLSDLIRITVFVAGAPAASELLVQYAGVDNWTLPAGLTGSAFFARVPTESNIQYTLQKNGASIGTINFQGPSPQNVTVTVPATVFFTPGDVFSLIAPVTPDGTQADISFTIVGELTL